ncbi:hypothetical protein [Deinococcus multiflagellatus]|uniref:Uncharacterized protein n=1 Tax=Deinococcus multiflagellatus TaxID=1656887 RepID=A0ABW1ZPC0_9DEIO
MPCTPGGSAQYSPLAVTALTPDTWVVQSGGVIAFTACQGGHTQLHLRLRPSAQTFSARVAVRWGQQQQLVQLKANEERHLSLTLAPAQTLWIMHLPGPAGQDSQYLEVDRRSGD